MRRPGIADTVSFHAASTIVRFEQARRGLLPPAEAQDLLTNEDAVSLAS